MHKNAKIKERERTIGAEHSTRCEQWELSNWVTKRIKHGNILSYAAIIHGLLIDLRKSAKNNPRAVLSLTHSKHGKPNQMAERTTKKKRIISTLENKQMLIINVLPPTCRGFKERKQKTNRSNNNSNIVPSPQCLKFRQTNKHPFRWQTAENVTWVQTRKACVCVWEKCTAQ